MVRLAPADAVADLGEAGTPTNRACDEEALRNGTVSFMSRTQARQQGRTRARDRLAARRGAMLDGLDVNTVGIYNELAAHFGQYGFFDRATYQQWLAHVIAPNVQWTCPPPPRHPAPAFTTAKQ